VEKNIAVNANVSGARQKTENYSVLYGLVTLVPSPFACQQATMTAVTAFYFIFGNVDHRKQPANAVALQLIEIEKYLFVTNFSTRRSFAEGQLELYCTDLTDVWSDGIAVKNCV
jgi:hypothetical protein